MIPAIEGFCNSAACANMLSEASDFSAGAGDALTGRMIPGVHSSLTEHLRGKDADSVVRKDSVTYKVGEYVGGTVGWSLIGAIIGKFINNNPILRFGRGWNQKGQRIWRFASGGRWGKGGPKLPWHRHRAVEQRSMLDVSR